MIFHENRPKRAKTDLKKIENHATKPQVLARSSRMAFLKRGRAAFQKRPGGGAGEEERARAGPSERCGTFCPFLYGKRGKPIKIDDVVTKSMKIPPNRGKVVRRRRAPSPAGTGPGKRFPTANLKRGRAAFQKHPGGRVRRGRRACAGPSEPHRRFCPILIEKTPKSGKKKRLLLAHPQATGCRQRFPDGGFQAGAGGGRVRMRKVAEDVWAGG